jgi:hypothetical protein
MIVMSFSLSPGTLPSEAFAELFGDAWQKTS